MKTHVVEWLHYAVARMLSSRYGLSLHLYHSTESRNRVIIIPTLYSGGPGIKSRPGDRLP
jgi:hypothetical protein